MLEERLDAVDRWLLGDEARNWLVEAAASALPVHQLAARLRRRLTPDQARRVLEVAHLRRRASSKFSLGHEMFFTPIGFEQATDEWTARYKAQRFKGQSVADLCCGVGGDAIGLAAAASETKLYDRSATAVAYAMQNLHVYAESRDWRVVPTVIEAQLARVGESNAWHVDPDRRPAGNRTTRPELHEPNDTSIDELLAENPNGAIKLAPACEVPGRWSQHGELEWISRDGECKQLVVWHGDLATEPGHRRATVLCTRSGELQEVRTIIGHKRQVEHHPTIERFVYEPDAAILASELVAILASEHGWWTFANTNGYVTGPTLIDDPAIAAFEVEDVLPFNRKKLALYLRERNVGRLEIKHRAVSLSPEQLRRELKLRGGNFATLLIARVNEKRIAVIARRVSVK